MSVHCLSAHSTTAGVRFQCRSLGRISAPGAPDAQSIGELSTQTPSGVSEESEK
jgi:hypothetical protein